MKQSFPEPPSPHHRSRFYTEHPEASNTGCSDTRRPAASEQPVHACPIRQSSSFYPIRQTRAWTSGQNDFRRKFALPTINHPAKKSPRISPNPGSDASIPSRVKRPRTFKGSLQLPTGRGPSPIRQESSESSPESDLGTRKKSRRQHPRVVKPPSSLQKIGPLEFFSTPGDPRKHGPG